MSEVKDDVLDAIMNDRPISQPSSESAPAPAAETTEQVDATIQPDLKTTETKEPEQPAAQPGSWISEASKSIGMELKSEDELKDFITKGKSYGDLESRFATQAQELEKFKTSSEVDPFANDTIKKLNELYKGGASSDQIKLFTEINSLDVKTLSPIEAKTLALQYEHGLSAEDAKTMINSTYKLDTETYDKGIVDAELIRLKVDSQKDSKFLDELQTKAAENPAQAKQEEYKANLEAYTKKVEPIAKSIQESLTAIKGVSLNGKNGAEAVTADLPISDESRARIADLVTQYAVSNNIPLDEQGQKLLNEFAENVAWIDNKQNFAIHIAAKTEERIRAEFHNPSSIDRGQDNPVDDKASLAKQQEAWVLENS